MASIDFYVLILVIALIGTLSGLATFRLKPPQPISFVIGGIFLFWIFTLTDNITVGYFEPQIKNITETSGGTINIVNYNQTIIPIQTDVGYTTNEGARTKLVLIMSSLFMIFFGVLAQISYLAGKRSGFG